MPIKAPGNRVNFSYSPELGHVLQSSTCRRPFMQLGILIFLAGCLVACSSGRQLMADQSLNEGFQLRDYCKQRGLKTPSVTHADSILKAAQSHIQSGDEEIGYWQAEEASLRFELAIQEARRIESQEQLQAEKTRMSHDRDQYDTYRQILEEVQSKRTP